MGWKGRKSKEKNGESQGPKLTISVLMQSRASFSNEKAVGIDGISAEILKSIPCRGLRKIRKAFEMSYLGKTKRKLRPGWEHHRPESQESEDEQIGGPD